MNMLLYALPAILVMACSTPPQRLAYERSGEVVALTHDDRTLTVRSKSVGSSQNDAAFYADVSVFENLLYKGIPKSNQELPIMSENDRTDTSRDYLTGFFNDGVYRQFITQQEIISHTVSGNNHFLEKELTIDLAAFRKHLVNKHLIRKFGITE